MRHRRPTPFDERWGREEQPVLHNEVGTCRAAVASAFIWERARQATALCLLKEGVKYFPFSSSYLVLCLLRRDCFCCWFFKMIFFLCSRIWVIFLSCFCLSLSLSQVLFFFFPFFLLSKFGVIAWTSCVSINCLTRNRMKIYSGTQCHPHFCETSTLSPCSVL